MFSQLKWFLLVSKTIVRYQPSQILYIVMLGFSSRIAATLALLLPVKVIMMAGRHKVPSYFPEMFNKMEMNDLMVLLSVVAVVLYVVHVVLDGFFSSAEKKGMRSFLQSLNIGEKDGRTTKILQKCYQRVADSMTELFFVTVVLLFILFAFPVLFVTLVTYTVLVVLGFEMIQHFRFSKNESAERDMADVEDSNENDNSQIARWVDVGFLVGFLAIVICVLFEMLPNVILVLVSFLLIRRASGGVKKFLKTVVFLEGHRPAVRDLIG